jgi:hypothetical protein
VKDKGFAVLIAIIVIAGMLVTGIGIAFAEPYHVLSGRDKVGTYGKDGQSARVGFINSICSEGATSDTNETCLEFIDPATDVKIKIGNTSGTLAISGASPVGATLTDAKILIGNSAGTATEQSLTASGDATGTLTNAGALALTQAANSIGVLQANINTVTLLVANTTSTNSVTIDDTHVLLSYYITTLGGINGTNLVNDILYEGSGVWTISMVNALVGGDAVWTLKLLKAD